MYIQTFIYCFGLYLTVLGSRISERFNQDAIKNSNCVVLLPKVKLAQIDYNKKLTQNSFIAKHWWRFRFWRCCIFGSFDLPTYSRTQVASFWRIHMINDIFHHSCSTRVTNDVAAGDLNKTSGLYSGVIGQIQRKVIITNSQKNVR